MRGFGTGRAEAAGRRPFATEWLDAGTGDPRDYHLRTRWHIPARLDEVLAVLAEPAELARWCPQVFLGVETLRRPAAGLEGTAVRLLTRGWLPYTLRFEAWVERAQAAPPRLVVRTEGDFRGRGEFRCAASGGPEGGVEVRLDWHVRVNKPLVARLSRLLAPVFARNHAWTMARGYEGLLRELARRRADARGEGAASRAA